MAMHTSLTRCLRTTSSTLLHQIPAQRSIRGQPLQLYRSQKLAYSLYTPKGDQQSETKNESNTTTTDNDQSSSSSSLPSTLSSLAEDTSPSPSPAEASKELENSLLDQLNLGPSPQKQSSDQQEEPRRNNAEEEKKLAARMTKIRNKMNLLGQKSPEGRSRVFQKTQYPFPESSSSTTTSTSTSTSTTTTSKSPSSSQGQMESLAKHLQLEETVRPTLKSVSMKLGPKLGRQIMVQNDKGVDCATAIRQLEMACSSNQLRKQERMQKFHVRRGQMRKDLRRERWRRLFKFSFLETVKKIERMRDQGW